MTSRSENPLTLAYWLGAFDARPLALFRICLGAVLLQDLYSRAITFSTFLTDDGVFPRSLLATPREWGLFNLSGDVLPLALLFLGGTVATLAFAFGYATRAATIASWVFWVSLHRRVPPIHTGGDGLIDILLFFGIFTDLAGRWSIDAIRRGARAEVRALAPRFMQAVPALLYLYTAYEKLKFGGRGWFFGPIIFQHMQLTGWIRPAGVWLGHHPTLCALFTGGTIIVELLVPLLFFMPFWIQPSRALAVACHVGLQVGILLTMKVGCFTNVMLAITPLWLQPEWLDALGGRFARQGVVDLPPWTPLRKVLAAALAVLFTGTITRPAIPRHLPLGMGLVVERLGLVIATRLFTSGFASVRWEASGRLADGTVVDPLSVVTSGALQDAGFLNTPWMQLPYRLEQYAPLGQFVCDHYAHDERGQNKSAALLTWTLTRISRVPYAPGQALPAEERRVLWEQTCSSR
jgi:hypothetical protein